MNRKFFIISIVILLITVFGYGFTVSEATLNNDDPLISLSYLNMIIDKLVLTINTTNQEQDSIISSNTTYITTHEAEIAQLAIDVKSITNVASSTLEVVEIFSSDSLLSKSGKSIITTGSNKIFVGKKIIADAGTEIILRYTSGSTTAITSESGGLSDVTGGADIQSGQNIPKNHLLLIPRSDGRGVLISDYAIFMIRGTYTVE